MSRQARDYAEGVDPDIEGFDTGLAHPFENSNALYKHVFTLVDETEEHFLARNSEVIDEMYRIQDRDLDDWKARREIERQTHDD